jgi:hypothetical protein
MNFSSAADFTKKPMNELRADGSATLSGVRATGIVEPTVRRCSAFQLEWKGSNNGSNSPSAQGC